MPEVRGRQSGKSAELLFCKWLSTEGVWFYHRARSSTYPVPGGLRASRSNDVFGVFDVIAALRPGRTPPSSAEVLIDASTSYDLWCVQITTPSQRSAKRRKIAAKGAYPRSWCVEIVTHEPTPDPSNRGKSLHFWRRDQLDVDKWVTMPAIQFDRAGVIDAARRIEDKAWQR
jgi:hypothetical protein